MHRLYLALLACLSLYGCGGDDSDIAAAVSGTHVAAVATASAQVTATVGSLSDASSGAPAMATIQAGGTGTEASTSSAASGATSTQDITSATPAGTTGTSQSVSGSINREPSTVVAPSTSTATGSHATQPTLASNGSTVSVAAVAVPATTTSTPSTPTVAPAPPTLSGVPAASAVAGKPYLFAPSVVDPSGAALTFSIQNAPKWATFASASGTLSGTPTTANVGTYANIVISVSDGTHTVNLPAFTIAVAQVTISGNTLSWTPPDLNADGTTLGDLAGYRVSYGTSASSLTQVVSIADATTDSYAIPTLSSGTWYFSVAAYNSSGVTGNASTVVEITL
jgi:hypothetical protein